MKEKNMSSLNRMKRIENADLEAIKREEKRRLNRALGNSEDVVTTTAEKFQKISDRRQYDQYEKDSNEFLMEFIENPSLFS